METVNQGFCMIFCFFFFESLFFACLLAPTNKKNKKENKKQNKTKHENKTVRHLSELQGKHRIWYVSIIANDFKVRKDMICHSQKCTKNKIFNV